MELDHSIKGQVKIGMINCISKMIDNFSVNVSNKTATTPATKHLFEVQDDAPKISEEEAHEFHHMVTCGPFACKRACCNIQMAITFLTTMVSQPNLDDWKKLV